jgi:mannose-1-phosphate guanylyltransferase
MFVVRATVLLDLLAEFHPALATGLRDIAAEPARLAQLWPGLTSMAIDTAVAEPAAAAGRVAVVPGPFTWDDVGDFASLGLPLARRDGVPWAEDPRVTSILCWPRTRPVWSSPAQGRTVAVLGLDDIVVVDTPDALLVTTRARAQDVKALVDLLKAAGRADLT